MLYYPRDILVCPIQFQVYPRSYLHIYRVSLDHNWQVYSQFSSTIPGISLLLSGYIQNIPWLCRTWPSWIRDIPNWFRDFPGYNWVSQGYPWSSKGYPSILELWLFCMMIFCLCCGRIQEHTAWNVFFADTPRSQAGGEWIFFSSPSFFHFFLTKGAFSPDPSLFPHMIFQSLGYAPPKVLGLGFLSEQ